MLYVKSTNKNRISCTMKKMNIGILIILCLVFIQIACDQDVLSRFSEEITEQNIRAAHYNGGT